MKNYLTPYHALIALFILIIASCSSKKQEKNIEIQETNDPQYTWEELFDGKTLNGWSLKEAEANFYVEDGMIVGEAGFKTPNCYLVTDKLYNDFVLELDFKVNSPLNSGVNIRSVVRERDTTIMYLNGNKEKQVLSEHSFPAGTVVGYQIEIDPSERAWTGGLYEVGGRGWLQSLKENTSAGKAYHVNEWNHFKIKANGNHLETWINGVLAIDVREDLWKTGFIGFQMHGVYDKKQVGKKMFFKNIRLRKLN